MYVYIQTYQREIHLFVLRIYGKNNQHTHAGGGAVSFLMSHGNDP